jgi:prophage maintenance system killer protein
MVSLREMQGTTKDLHKIPAYSHKNRMKDLTVEQVIGIHDTVTADTGDDMRLLSEANLHQMVFLTNRREDPIKKAAFVLFSICAYPPFRDGNKRSALLVADIILEGEGICRDHEDDGIFELMRGVPAFTVEPEDIEHWLRRHTAKK